MLKDWNEYFSDIHLIMAEGDHMYINYREDMIVNVLEKFCRV